MELKRSLSRLLTSKESYIILGPRGTGKTKLVSKLLKGESKKIEINLLKAKEFRRFISDPSQLEAEVLSALSELKTGRLRIFIDEVQKVPELLDEVHNLIETEPQRLQFFLTGSSARKLKRSGANLLAGRALMRHMHPFTAIELGEKFRLERALTIGTLPKAYLLKTTPVSFLESYVGTYLREEILQESLVRRLENFHRFIEVAAQMNGKFVNYSKIAKDVGVSPKTVQEYFGILVDTLLAFRLEPWSRSVREQLKLQPKYYVFDNGVLNALRGELRIDLKRSSYRFGDLFESFVIQELFRRKDYHESDARLFVWRNENDDEVDCIVDFGLSLPPTAVEIKSSSAPREADVENLLIFNKYHPDARLICLSTTPRPYKIGKVDVLPWSSGIEKALTRPT